MNLKTFMLTTCAMLVVDMAQAQTDYTSLIKNPSFEQETEGWIQKGMSAQGNTVFTIKDGQTYMERWTGRGGAVGSGRLAQELRDLPPGNYELTAAAQNIQENSPQAAQTGAWIFAGDNKTTVTVRGTYTVPFNFVSGSITIGFEAVNASGNWIAVDNFRLTLVGSDLSAELAAAIEQTSNTYGSVTGRESQQLQDAIAAARNVAANAETNASQQAAAIVAMQQAVDIYLRANASSEQPLDLTSSIVNPSFEDGLEGWSSEGMSVQGNNVFSIKQGNNYVERWTSKGGAVGDARVAQRLTGMLPGRYRLKAVAQNIQENSPTQAQSGTWLFANGHRETVTVRADYTLEFVLVSDELEIGFEAVEATGNWISVDHFRLEYISDSFDDIKTAFEALLTKADDLATQRINASAHQALEEAIAAARPLASQLTAEGWPAAARALEAAIQTATTSQQVFARLAAAIADANNELTSSAATQTADYQTAIANAQAIYDADTATDAQAEAAIVALAEASFAFKVANGTGSGVAPTVVTDTRFIRGATWAFGRSTVKGSNIVEEGFCWAEHPDPKVTDNRTSDYLNQAGKIYWLRDLKPATIYYMRAYAINKDYAVGYGDVVKFVTVPKGTIGHWYNNGGDEEINDRLNYAINTAMDYYWNNLTSIHGFGISVTYSPGTPTADCSYGGSMRVGASSSYQQVGTIMHEAFHGIGVGTHNIWWNGEMRSAGNRGDWLGDRATEAVRFWDNSTTAVITGDDMHLWPYGCNGAHEDTHNDNLYCMMGILAQALGEDGLPASGEIGYALPYYAFNHEDGVKYYIKNEDAKHGLHSSYLVETSDHQLQWQSMDADEAATNDAAAWYLTFTPGNQYYQLRNAASGYYMTYASGIKTANHAKPTTADNFHLMRGRVDVEGHRGYYIIHPESSANPPTLVANASGKTGTAAWNIAKSATTQRWLILTAEEAANFDNGNLDESLKALENMLAQIRRLAETPHTERVEGADETLEQQLAAIEQQAQTSTKGSEIDQLTTQARAKGMTFLSHVSASDIENPFDLTFMLENPDFTTSSTEGWTTTKTPGYDVGCDEFYETTFNFYQMLTDMPAGTYQLRANAFQRPGETKAAYTQYAAGNSKITTSLYINNTSAPVKSLFDDRQPSRLYTDDIQLDDNTYVPCVMKAAAKYFAKGLYDSQVSATLDASASLRVGIKCTSAPTWYWTFFDNFRLYFYGGNNAVVGVDCMEAPSTRTPVVYDLSGRRVTGKGLRPGLYIIDGKKIFLNTNNAH